MGFYTSIEISASALSAERLAMDVIANNIANANTTRTPQGGAFKRQLIVFAQKPAAPAQNNDGFAAKGGFPSFNGDTSAKQPSVDGVEALGIVQDRSPDRLVFDPGNPEADARGYVHYPNVQIVKEMVDLMAASRAYEANVSSIQETKAMNAAATNLLNS
ncbi:MAG TPA: flagellar basal body rod protein FlgC [Candidatus Baltobacteraceae bacterium]|nr:flagellar basal body rod protein FlgC [Candidatus Baltobacteraceae bacterium]